MALPESVFQRIAEGHNLRLPPDLEEIGQQIKRENIFLRLDSFLEEEGVNIFTFFINTLDIHSDVLVNFSCGLQLLLTKSVILLV